MLPFKIDFNKVAIIIVDLQRGYCDPKSDCAQPPLSWDVSAADELCRLHIPFLDAARKIIPSERIIWTQMEEHPDTYAKNTPMPYDPDFVELWVRGTPGHDFHVVSPIPGEPILFKTHPSAFHREAKIVTERHKGTDLDTYLRAVDVETTLTTGVIGPRCVNGTLVGSSIMGFNTLAARDLIGHPQYGTSDIGSRVDFDTEANVHAAVTDFFYAHDVNSSKFLQLAT